MGSLGCPFGKVWALHTEAFKVADYHKEVPRHLTKYIRNILHDVVAQISLKCCQQELQHHIVCYTIYIFLMGDVVNIKLSYA
jgi:hypothetical protein